ncbi:MAG: hypothetical protein M2R45_04776 [Verrucomicrobia subdivision 3 bacterium]|nr:hypothetical protein [Limisphaerales bacterium]MCS1417421.1 hypothetical protein [Limisphaerales bacterium]
MELLTERALIQEFTVSRKEHESHSDVDKHLKTANLRQGGISQSRHRLSQKAYSLLENKRHPFESQFNLHRHPLRSLAKVPNLHQRSCKPKGVADTPSRKKIFIEQPKSAEEEVPRCAQIPANLATKAFRRPASEADLDKLMACQQGRK